jgi:hypothetical protein
MVPGIPNPTFVAGTTTSRKVTKAVNKDVPVGENVSKEYPWFSGFKQTLSGVINSEAKLVRPGSGITTFINTTDRTIKLNEIRFVAANRIVTAFPAAFLSQLNINNRLGVKVKHTDYEIVSEWIPCGMLNTHNNIASSIPRCNLAMSMPTPYYLQAGHPFRVRIRSTNIIPDRFGTHDSYVFYMVLFGKDPRTNKPYELIKEITIPYISGVLPTDANPQYVDVVFDDNRDAPMRDLLLTHVGFSLSPYTAGYAGNTSQQFVFMYPQQLELQFMPPEGPKWQEIDDWLPIANVIDQGTTLVDVSYVAYKPDVPMTLEPRQQIDIDTKVLWTMFIPSSDQANVSEVPLWVTLLGTQKQKAD